MFHIYNGNSDVKRTSMIQLDLSHFWNSIISLYLLFQVTEYMTGLCNSLHCSVSMFSLDCYQDKQSHHPHLYAYCIQSYFTLCKAFLVQADASSLFFFFFETYNVQEPWWVSIRHCISSSLQQILYKFNKYHHLGWFSPDTYKHTPHQSNHFISE